MRRAREVFASRVMNACTDDANRMFNRRRRIGTEHEKFGFDAETKRRMDYDVVNHILTGLVDRHGWKPIMEKENIIGCTASKQSVTLEPGD